MPPLSSPATVAPRSSFGSRALAVAAVLLATAGYVLFHANTHNTAVLRGAAEKLLQGHTHWLTFQNRILGPLLIEAIRLPTGWPWIVAYRAFIAATMASGALVLLWRSWRDSASSRRGLAQSGVWFGSAMLFNHWYSYPWDYAGALLFLLLLVWARDRCKHLADFRSLHLVVLLLLLALNRESSLIVLVCLGATALVRGWYEQKWREAAKTIGVFALAAVVNVAGVVWLRTALFTTPTRPAGSQESEAAIGNFLQLHFNAVVCRNMFHQRDLFLGTLITVLLAVISLQLVRNVFKDLRGPHRMAAGDLFTAGCFVVAAIGIVFFGAISELRVYMEHVPMITLLFFESDLAVQPVRLRRSRPIAPL